jgi:hypothetical protein
METNNEHNVTCCVYVMRQVNLRFIGSSEFIPLALTLTQFTILKLLPSAVSQLQLWLESLSSSSAILQLTSYSLSSNSLFTAQ